MSHSQKISQFNTQALLQNTDLFTFVRNGQNTNATFQTIKDDLGVTGTISPTGDPAGSPILETVQAGEYNIRNAESGPGVIVSISPQNGLLIGWNVSQDPPGIPITSGISAPTPAFISLIPGSGMQISKDGDVITFSVTGGALPATKAVAVNVIGDYPAAVAGVITLEADTVYILSNDISTSNRFVRQNNTSMVGYSELGPTLEYTGTGTMFTSVDSNTLLSNIGINCPNGKVVDWSDTTGNTKTETIRTVRVGSCISAGSYTNGAAVVIENFGSFSVADKGFEVFGLGWLLVSFSRVSMVAGTPSFVGVDLGTSSSESIGIDMLAVIGPPGSVGVTGSSGSANITSGNLASIINCSFGGATTPITAINPVSDVRWRSIGNDGIGDSRDDSLISIQGNTDETVISTIGVPVLMSGTWSDNGSSRIVVTPSGGRMTYVGERPMKLPIDYSISIIAASGGDKQVSAYIGINGSPITETRIEATASSSKAGTISTMWQHTFVNGDFVEAFLENDTDTTNLIGQSAIARID